MPQTKISANILLPEPIVPVVKKTALEDVFEEIPVPLDVFVKDKQFLNNPPLGHEQFEAVRYAERIYYSDLYPVLYDEGYTYWSPDIRMVNLITLEWGKGSGKDHICRVASLRIAYLLLCLKSPQGYYGLPPQDTIHSLNVASSATQAARAFFKPMTEAVKTGWFKDKCEPKQLSIAWDKHHESISGHSDAESQEGLNLILGVADEVDAFRSKDEIVRNRAQSRDSTKTAESVLTMIQSSASTRFPFTYKFMRISYPRYVGSTIQRLRKAAVTDVERNGENSRHYVSGPMDTWDINPRFKDVEFVNVPGCEVPVPKILENDFLDDLAEANGKYRCRPSRSQRPYFHNFEIIESCMVERDPVKLDCRLVTSSRGGKVWEPVYILQQGFNPIVGAQYAMHADLAAKHDRAGIAVSHVESWRQEVLTSVDEDGGESHHVELMPVVKTDFVVAYEADLTEQPAREIQLRWARQLAFRLQELGFNIRLFTFDGWQSMDSIQILESRGIEAKVQSIDKTDVGWKTLRDLSAEGRLTFPDDPLLRIELQALTRLGGGRVDHPPGGSKDKADALVGSVLGALELGGSEDEHHTIAVPGRETFEVIPLPAGEVSVMGGMWDAQDSALPLGLDGPGSWRL